MATGRWRSHPACAGWPSRRRSGRRRRCGSSLRPSSLPPARATGARNSRAALVVIGSFLLEGHTASSHERILAAPLLFVHLAAVHWWLGALLPLIALTWCAEPATVVATIEAFGARAMWVVAALRRGGRAARGSADGRRRAPRQRLPAKAADQAFAGRGAPSDCGVEQAAAHAVAPARLRSWRAALASVHPARGRRGAAILAASAWLVSTAPDA